MKARYKQSWLPEKGNIATHRKVWIEAFGEIPDGCVIHHIDEDKRNNDIDNLALMTPAGHTRLHSLGRPAWNKGANYGGTDAYKKSNETRLKNHDKTCLETLKTYEDDKLTQQQLADQLSISRRQICDRFKRAREIRKMGDSQGSQEA